MGYFRSATASRIIATENNYLALGLVTEIIPSLAPIVVNMIDFSDSGFVH